MSLNSSLLFLSVSLLVLGGCSRALPRVVANQPAKDAGSAALAALDADKNGALTMTELEKAPGLKVAFQKVDANHDNKITPDEIDQRVKQWAESQVGRMSISCQVRKQGKPLANAEVRFVPEAFLGTAMESATGTTDKDGFAEMGGSQSGEGALGMSPGFYRVEITHASVLPPKYNTETTLGAEIAIDADAMQAGPLSFDLQ